MTKKQIELQRVLDDKSLTRREFLGYTSAMGLSVAAAAPCGPDARWPTRPDAAAICAAA